MGNIASIIGKQKKAVASEEEFDRRTKHLQGFDGVDIHSEDYMKIWKVQEKARETPKPLHLKPKILAECKETEGENDPVASWCNWLGRDEFKDKPFVIFGAGSSTLEMPLSLLDGLPVYGINWTLRWFEPTFLQIIDTQPFHSEIRENRAWSEIRKRTQLVCSMRCAYDFAGHARGKYLKFKIAHSAYRNVAKKDWFAETPDDQITHYANSLGYACNVAYWFRPSRIVLLGMDFGGPHFFGDGRAVGSLCHYGMGGDVKKRLLPSLEILRDNLAERGQSVVHCGPSKLDLFPKTNDLEQALYG